MQRGDITEILQHVNPAACSYGEWIAVGMALKSGGYGCDIWDTWSRGDPARYKSPPDSESCPEKWRSFSEGGGVTMGTLMKMAKDGGYVPHKGKTYRTASSSVASTKPSYDACPIRGVKPIDRLTPPEQLKAYLLAMFSPGDIVAYVTDDVAYVGGRWAPRKGVFTRTAGEILAAIDSHPEDLAGAVGRWRDECGAWIRINAMTGEGITNADVATFRYALVESDEVTIKEQLETYKALRLPIACLVHSGGKSLHAIVRVDASGAAEYRERVRRLYSEIEKEGVRVDHADSNPSRLSRMPGVTRRGKIQKLVATDMGSESYDDWTAFMSARETRSGEDYPLNFTKPPDPTPEIIKGVLRFGHKMLVSGASKAAKSFFLIELGISISQGKEYLGFPTHKSRVLYYNMEIDEKSFDDRVISVGKALGVKRDAERNFLVRNMRGSQKTVEELVSDTIKTYEGKGIGCVIIDPIYKVMQGDENSARDMTRFTVQLDRLCQALGCAVIYAHHHSKGAQGGKVSIDRGSGSGVLARDADAIIDLTEMEVPDGLLGRHGLPDTVTALEMDVTTRDFAKPGLKKIYFLYPLHREDTEGIFAGCGTRGAVKPEPKKPTERLGKPPVKDKKTSEERMAESFLCREKEVLDAFAVLGKTEAAATELARVMAGDAESDGYDVRVATKRHMVYEICKSSERVNLCDKKIILLTEDTRSVKCEV